MNKSRFILAVLVCLLTIPRFSSARECIDYPRVMTQEALGKMTTGKIVLVEPFTDYTKIPGDDWLSFGLRDLLASMLAACDGLGVISGLAAVYHPEAKSPTFIVSGMFQHVGENFRAFVKVMKGDDRSLVSQYEMTSLYPGHIELFFRLADITRQIWKSIGVSGDDSRLETVRDAAGSTQVFEYYSRGRQALDTYKIADTEVAKTWFEQAKRSDYRSPLGYHGMIDLLTFLGFYHKQRREPFGQYFEQAERELAQMQQLAKRPPPVVIDAKKPSKKKGDKSAKIDNRFLLGHAAFTEGLFNAEAGNWQPATDAMLKAVGFVPEDAIAWYQLSRIYLNLGNTAESSKALQKAYAINPCVEK